MAQRHQLEQLTAAGPPRSSLRARIEREVGCGDIRNLQFKHLAHDPHAWSVQFSFSFYGNEIIAAGCGETLAKATREAIQCAETLKR